MTPAPTLFDTHCHLYAEPLVKNIADIIKKAGVNGVGKILVPGVDVESSKAAIDLAYKFPGIVYAAVGIHPQIPEDGSNPMELFAEIARMPGVAAIGEIGIDTEEGADISIQESRFSFQLEIAVKLGLPVLIHCRGGFRFIADQLKKHAGEPHGGIFHAWSGSPELAKEIRTLGFFIGISGVVTRPGAVKARRYISSIPLSGMVLETDSPYIGTSLKPRGMVEPADIKEICAAIATLKNVPFDEVAGITTRNAEALFASG